MKKLWGGRFSKTPEQWIEEFGASISFDQQLVLEDIDGSLAHVKMLGKTGILSQDECEQIQAGLLKLKKKAQAGELEYSVSEEDIHLNIEKMLIEEIGPVGGKLHTGRSRNDQVATDMHLYLKKQVKVIIAHIKELQAALVTQAEKNVETILPGYTHLQRAQPVSFGHHLLAYFWMLERDKQRFEESLKRIDISPLGASALAGTTFPIDRHYSAEMLGFSSVYENSMDAVSDRDFIVEFLSNSALAITHLTRLAEEMILWSSKEFSFIELDDTYATGSSIMPQKKNPDMAELIRGKSGRVFGNLISMLTILKGLPLTYNKDMQEDKEGMFDTVHTMVGSLKIFAGMVETMAVKADVMKEAVNQDFSNATELADYLAAKGIPFREAHEIVGKLVLYCIHKNCYLLDLSLEEFKDACDKISDDVYNVLSPIEAVRRRNSYGGTGFEQVKIQLERAKKLI
ncbi:argininosuccinate lyase [Siminovitchia sp. FSL H7-0308]|uniref:Argininosuccinate lyase n=1 Tax=Siminovitchia thermophila TaxID=1245522 RepID=A0ABS2R6C3_9BACI|nr:argininosuccinate lyase [Siminovitchia thermophila]MBM7715207.1 argininosuccinate lyase [Siminovitchia thermophila]ONK24060.1 argininosuccinate lyase [Bacillus sp. VT-16-64]